MNNIPLDLRKIVEQACKDEVKANLKSIHAQMSELQWQLQVMELETKANLNAFEAKLMEETHAPSSRRLIPEVAPGKQRISGVAPAQHFLTGLSETVRPEADVHDEPLDELAEKRPLVSHRKTSTGGRPALNKMNSVGDQDVDLSAAGLKLSQSSLLLGDDFEHVTVNVLTDRDEDAERASDEYRCIVKNAKEEYNLNADVFGAATLVILKDLPDLALGEIVVEQFYRISMVCLCLLLTLVLQAMLLWWIAKRVLSESVTNIQLAYKKFHSTAFIAGTFDQEAFDSLGDQRRGICELAISETKFMAACLFLWIARCANEMRRIYRRKRAFDLLPALPAGVHPAHMVHELTLKQGDVFRESKNMIVCMNSSTRLSLNLLIFLPRIIVAVSLLFLGTAFLTATETGADLILNSLGLGFVYNVDDLIMKCFLPLRLAQTVTVTKIMAPQEEHAHGTSYELAQMKASYKRSTVVFAAVTVFLFGWLWKQPIIPGYEWDVKVACKHYLEVARGIPCKVWDDSCFPK